MEEKTNEKISKESTNETSRLSSENKAVSILISIVLGALLLAGLYALFADTLLPLIQERVMDIFDYAG